MFKMRKGAVDPVIIPILLIVIATVIMIICVPMAIDKAQKSKEETTQEDVKITPAIEFKNEYEALNGKEIKNGKLYRELNIPKENPFVKTTPAKVLEKIKNGDDVILYVGDPICPWCRSVLEQAVKSAKENNVDKIYYIDFWDDEHNEILRDVFEYKDGEVIKTVEATKEYTELLDLCDDSIGLRDYTIKTENDGVVVVNNKRFYGPTFVRAEKGKIVKYVNVVSDKQKGPFDELTDEIKQDMSEKFNELFSSDCDRAC